MLFRSATRLMGATFDASALYRFNAVQRMLKDEALTTQAVSAHVRGLQQDLVDCIAAGQAGALQSAELLNPLDDRPHARFLAFRHPKAQAWKAALMEADAIVDVRDDVLRVGLGLYHDREDIERFCGLCRKVLKQIGRAHV